ncbi:MAG: SRPBCC domain-containing protein [Cytophagales bacterium]|nr:SRPBCC domain-containing protein [Cytophagales bacterium]
MSKLYTEDEVIINAPISKVWEALIDPAITKKYMFGCEVECDWKLGSPVIWRGAEDGIEYVTGTLVQFEKEKCFAFTTFDPHGEYEDAPENYLTATYTLSSDDRGTTLKVTQGDYAAVAEGQKRYEDTLAQGGWSSVLDQIKAILEAS